MPISLFNGNIERPGEFIPLSLNPSSKSDGTCVKITSGLDCESTAHSNRCEHFQSHSSMLVECIENVAYGLVILRVDRKGWEEVGTQKKHETDPFVDNVTSRYSQVV